MDASSFRTPLTLRGRYTELSPLAASDRDALFAASRDPEVFRYLRTGPVENPSELDVIISGLLAAQAAGTDLPFTTRLLPDRRPIGMTRFLRIDRADESVEVGGTWLAREFWRTPVNTETKLLLLRHAFEVEHAHRVQLQTDLRNERSQRAIARLGAQREGVLREDVRLPDGYRRSSVYFSILAPEWPAVRDRLTRALERPWGGSEAP
ncbi:MAG TPA: GNAT family protein [Thermoplasmata archaeon]|nr:GNAT family protein [Thermoplasmata archaeon]